MRPVLGVTFNFHLVLLILFVLRGHLIVVRAHPHTVPVVQWWLPVDSHAGMTHRVVQFAIWCVISCSMNSVMSTRSPMITIHDMKAGARTE